MGINIKMPLKMLIISPFIPYDNVGHAGGKTHNYYLKKFHQSKEFEVKLITFSSPDDLKKQDLDKYGIDYKVIVFSRKFIARAIRYVWRKINALNIFDKKGAFIAPYFKKAIIEELKKLKVNGYKPDIILMEWTQIVLLIDEIKKIFPNCFFISSEVEVSFLRLERELKFMKGTKKIIKRIQFKNWKKFELYTLKLSDLIVVQSIKDKDLLTNEGIDTRKIHCIYPYYMSMFNLKTDYYSKNIIFFGNMGSVQNYLSITWFINNVYIKLIKKYTKAKLFIIGGNPPKNLLKYQSKNIIITGFVDNPEVFFKKSCLMVVPLVFGGGIKVKVIEGMSAGLPIITNNIGIEGIPTQKGIEYLHAETIEEYIKNIVKIFENPKFAKKIGENGSMFIKANFDYKNSFVGYKQRILKDII